jgi:hypothetical protein
VTPEESKLSILADALDLLRAHDRRIGQLEEENARATKAAEESGRAIAAYRERRTQIIAEIRRHVAEANRISSQHPEVPCGAV